MCRRCYNNIFPSDFIQIWGSATFFKILTSGAQSHFVILSNYPHTFIPPCPPVSSPSPCPFFWSAKYTHHLILKGFFCNFQNNLFIPGCYRLYYCCSQEAGQPGKLVTDFLQVLVLHKISKFLYPQKA